MPAVIGWCLLPLNAHRLYMCIFLSFIAIYLVLFPSRSSSFILSLLLLLTLFSSLFTLHSAHRVYCVRVRCILWCAFEIKRISPRFAHLLISLYLFLSEFYLLISRFMRVSECISVCVCVCFWERRSASALICFSKYFELFNINEAVKRYLFYEKTSTRSDQTTARRQTRLRIEKKYRDFLLLLLRRKHESLSLEHCCCYSLLWLKVCNFDFISIRPLNISDLFSHAN